ncbi:MAG: RsmB/NOP family class I SAM-dependent RNA methyltransferase [Candidatus Bathyarchaeota archaeon]|nr:RsmB/NOP family class I SAM-dependent RNA methyltransferase [Candidatus Bathyarchaeota archaeon]
MMLGKGLNYSQRVFRYYERYKDIIPGYDEFLSHLLKPLPHSIRVNTLKISPERLIQRMEAKGFILKQSKLHPWFFEVEYTEERGLGATLEHTLGYYYVQEIVSGIPPIALDPKPWEVILDMAAAPGSKTTQIAQMMGCKGTIVANDISRERIKALKSNLDRLGVTNTVITVCDARRFRSSILFDRILLDAPCSSEATIRKDPSLQLDFSYRSTKWFSRLQKGMVERAYNLLKDDGVLVYSVCTFAPEECEEVVEHALKIGFKIEQVNIPLKHMEGIVEWVDEKGRRYRFDPDVSRSIRIYPHFEDTGGMFIAKFRKV